MGPGYHQDVTVGTKPALFIQMANKIPTSTLTSSCRLHEQSWKHLQKIFHRQKKKTGNITPNYNAELCVVYLQYKLQSLINSVGRNSYWTLAKGTEVKNKKYIINQWMPKYIDWFPHVKTQHMVKIET